MTNPFTAKLSSGGGNLGCATVGAHKARLTALVDCGLQPQSFEGVAKPAKQELILIYELLDDTVEIDGVLSNRMFSCTVTFPMTDKSNMYKHMQALDPTGVLQGDFIKMLGVQVTLVLVAKAKADGTQGVKLGSIAPTMVGDVYPPATLPNYMFTPSAPDMSVWSNQLHKWMKEKIISAQGFVNTPCAAAVAALPVEGSPAPVVPPVVQQQVVPPVVQQQVVPPVVQQQVVPPVVQQQVVPPVVQPLSSVPPGAVPPNAVPII
jgi:hypothetical protein